MKITAKFDSVDGAEFAAMAVRRLGEGVFDVSLSENRRKVHRDGDFAPMGLFTNLNTGTLQPLGVVGNISEASNADVSTSATVNIICRPSEAKKVVSLLMNGGGHDIKAK